MWDHAYYYYYYYLWVWPRVVISTCKYQVIVVCIKYM
jgi:hypothetical protein